MTPQEIVAAIKLLTAEELAELNRLLGEEGLEGGAGVREPLHPAPESPGDRVAVTPEGWPEPAPLPPDYWETAE